MSRSGFTLVEITVALVLLSVAVLGIASSAGRMVLATSSSGQKAAAVEAAHERLSLVRLHPIYGDVLDSLFTGVENDLPAPIGEFTRTTEVQHVVTPLEDGGVLDYVRVDVTVAGTGLGEAVVASTILAAP